MSDYTPANSMNILRRMSKILGINIEHVRKVTVTMEVGEPVLIDVQYVARNNDVEYLEQELVGV